MKFLTFDNLLDKNIHISKFKNIKEFDDNMYKIINNSCVINLTYTSILLYKLYKVFYIIVSKNLYVTIINNFKLYDNKFINLLLKLSDNNFFNSKYWIKGLLTNNDILNNVLILGLWANKFYSKFINTDTNVYIPYSVIKIINKIQYMYDSLKLKRFSKFIFLLNIDTDKYVIKECISSNKFIMGICTCDYNTKFIDFYMYLNNKNEITLNFIIKFILIASINASFNKAFINK